jgi:hypothetical protein
MYHTDDVVCPGERRSRGGRIMKRLTAGFLIVLLIAGLFSCSRKAPDSDITRFAEEFFRYMKARNYDHLFLMKAMEFQESDPKAKFVQDMKELESFGSVVSFSAEGPPEFSLEAGGRIARVSYLATFALGEGTFALKLTESRDKRRWELLGLDYKMSRKIRIGPYQANETGMVRLLSNFFYLWQTRQYDKLTADLGLEKVKEKFGEYLKNLEGAGDFCDYNLRSVSKGTYEGRKALKVVTGTEFTHMTGALTFKLIETDGIWKIYSLHFDLRKVRR